MSTYRRLLNYMLPYKGRLLLAAFSMLLFSIFNSMVSVAVYIVTNGIFNQGKVVIKDLPLLNLEQAVELPLSIVPVVVITVFLLRGIFDFIGKYLMANVGLRAVMALRNDLFYKITSLSFDFFSKGRTGDMMSRIMSDVTNIQGAISEVLVDLFKQPLTILFNIGLVFFWGGKLAFIGIVVFPLVAIPIGLLGRRIKRMTHNALRETGDLNAILEEVFNGIRVVKAFTMEDKENAKFAKMNKKVFLSFKNILTMTVLQKPLVEIMGAFGVAGAVWFGMQMLSPERFIAFITSMFILYEPIKKLSKVNSSINQSIGAGKRIFEIIDTENAITECEKPKPFNRKVEKIHFDHISFHYDQEKPVLKNVDLEVQAGEVIAFVGPSGSGKTTILNMLPRFYDPIEGSVKINGVDVREFKIKELRDNIGLVTQEIILFNGTIAENISYGREHSTQEEIVKAAEMAHAHEFIDKLPDGYDTQIGEKGFLLSGGQRQRIAIARAILKDAPILILDEATSHLDTQSEREVQTALENLMVGKTVFLIAHRLSTIQKANRILVLDKGEIVQSGDSETLLAEDGIYKTLYELQ